MLINSCGSASKAFTINGLQNTIKDPGDLCEEPSAVPQKCYIQSAGLKSNHRSTKALSSSGFWGICPVTHLHSDSTLEWEMGK